MQKLAADFVRIFILVLLMGVTARAEILIEIDISDPSSVTLKATSNLPSLNDSSTNMYAGVILDNFFQSAIELDPFSGISSSLLPTAGGASYTEATNVYVAVVKNDLNIFGFSGNTQVFSTSMPAFTGMAAFNFTGLILPSTGTSGDIFVGDTVTGSGAVIGQWQVVPEPTTATFLLVGGCGALVWRRKR